MEYQVSHNKCARSRNTSVAMHQYFIAWSAQSFVDELIAFLYCLKRNLILLAIWYVNFEVFEVRWEPINGSRYVDYLSDAYSH